MNDTVLDVQGMTCPSCVRHIEKALFDLKGVAHVSVLLREGKVRVQHQAEVETETLVEALEDAGYASRAA